MRLIARIAAIPVGVALSTIALAALLASVTSPVASAQDPPLGPTLVTSQAGSRVVPNTKLMNFASGCTVTQSGTQANVSCNGSGGSVTSIAMDAFQNITLTPNPLIATGTVGLNLTANDTWTGLHTFARATTGVTTGSSSGIQVLPSWSGNGGVSGNTATPIGMNFTPTFNLLATGGSNTSGYTAMLINATETAIGSGAKKLLDLEANSASKFYVTNTGSWFSPLIDSGISAPGFVALSANTNFAAQAGAGSISLSGMTGDMSTPTGDFSADLAAGKNVLLRNASGGGGALTFTGDAGSNFTTTTGGITIDPAAALLLGSSAATSVTTAKAGIRNSQLGMVNLTVGGVLSISTNTIVITANIHHVGAGLLKTITVPGTLTAGTALYIVPDAAFTYDATGNIVVPVGGGVAITNKLMIFAFDGSKFTPSY